MSYKELLEMLEESDRQGHWLFRLSDIGMFFHKERTQTTIVSLSRHAKDGLITRVAKGLYANKNAKSMPLFPLESIATRLRYKGTIYLSLESVLSDEGLISQIPNRLIFISKNRSQTFYTPFGIIEFVHSKKGVDFFEECRYDRDRGIWVAKPELALADAYQHNRSIDLIEEQRQKDTEYGY